MLRADEIKLTQTHELCGSLSIRVHRSSSSHVVNVKKVLSRVDDQFGPRSSAIKIDNFNVVDVCLVTILSGCEINNFAAQSAVS